MHVCLCVWCGDTQELLFSYHEPLPSKTTTTHARRRPYFEHHAGSERNELEAESIVSASCNFAYSCIYICSDCSPIVLMKVSSSLTYALITAQFVRGYRSSRFQDTAHALPLMYCSPCWGSFNLYLFFLFCSVLFLFFFFFKKKGLKNIKMRFYSSEFHLSKTFLCLQSTRSLQSKFFLASAACHISAFTRTHIPHKHDCTCVPKNGFVQINCYSDIGKIYSSYETALHMSVSNCTCLRC